MKKREILLIGGILGAALIVWAFFLLLSKKPAVSVQVTVSGELVETLDLNRDTDLVIQGYENGTNHLIIKDGEVYIEEASCPDKVCVKQGKINQTGQTIVCLPNQMVVTVIGLK